MFRGENPKEGAILTFWVKDFTGEEVEIEIKNALDQPVGKLKAPGTPGLNGSPGTSAERGLWSNTAARVGSSPPGDYPVP